MTDSSEFDVEAQIRRVDNVQQIERNDLLSKFMDNIQTIIICSSAILFFIGIAVIGNAYFYPLYAINSDQRSILMDNKTTDAGPKFDYDAYLAALAHPNGIKSKKKEIGNFKAAYFMTSAQLQEIANPETDFGFDRMKEMHAEYGAGVVIIKETTLSVSIWTDHMAVLQEVFDYASDEFFSTHLTEIENSESQAVHFSAEFGKATNHDIRVALDNMPCRTSYDKIVIYQGGSMAVNYNHFNIQAHDQADVEATQETKLGWQRNVGEHCTSRNWCINSKCTNKDTGGRCMCGSLNQSQCNCVCMSEAERTNLAHPTVADEDDGSF